MSQVCWIYFVVPGSAATSRATATLETAPLSKEGRREAKRAGRLTEHVQAVVSSPDCRAWQTASVIAPSVPVRLDADLRCPAPMEARQAGGVASEQTRDQRAGSPGGATAPVVDAADASDDASSPRLVQAIRRLEQMDGWCVLVVADATVVRSGVRILTGQTLPPLYPRPSEVVLISRRPQGWRLGRRSSSPLVLRSPIERDGYDVVPEPPR